MLILKFTPTKNDYLKSFLAFYLRKWLILLAMLLIIVVQLVCILFSFIRGDLGLGFNGFLPIFILIAVLFFFVFAFLINPYLAASKVDKDERLNSPVQVEIDEDHLMTKNRFVETKLDWGSFQSVIESKEHYLLILAVNKNMFQIIPKRAFTTPGDEQAFRELLAAKIPKKPFRALDLKSPGVIIAVLLATGFCMLIVCVAAVSFIATAYRSW